MKIRYKKDAQVLTPEEALYLSTITVPKNVVKKNDNPNIFIGKIVLASLDNPYLYDALWLREAIYACAKNYAHYGCIYSCIANNRSLNLRVIEIAIANTIKHNNTDYDQMRQRGVTREAARELIKPIVDNAHVNNKQQKQKMIPLKFDERKDSYCPQSAKERIKRQQTKIKGLK